LYPRGEVQLKIGEIARMARVSVRTLHHYDAIGLFKPNLVGESGHRIYASHQLETLRHILTLKSLGFALDEVGAALNGAAFDLLIMHKRQELLLQRNQIDDRLQRIEQAVKQERRMKQYQIELKTLPGYRVFAARGTAKDYRHVSEPMNRLFKLVEQELRSQQLESAQPCVVVWHGDYRSEEQFTLEVAMGFDGEAKQNSGTEVILTELPSQEVVSTLHHGSFERFGEAYAALFAFMDSQKLVANGATREVYIHVDQDEEKHVSELQIPVRKPE
jgi:DNA-binding transcriptional MerR regulator